LLQREFPVTSCSCRHKIAGILDFKWANGKSANRRPTGRTATDENEVAALAKHWCHAPRGTWGAG